MALDMKTACMKCETALEAMGAGMPVVTTTVGVEGLTLENEIFILRRDEPAEFASAVVELLSDRARMSKLGSAARSWVESNYTWRRAMAALEGVYRELTLPQNEDPEGSMNETLRTHS